MIKPYSEWHKIDLHIHTSFSKKTKQNDYWGKFSIDTLKDRLRSNDVDIFSLTDHNIFNLEAYEEYYKTADENAPLLLIGIELDIAVDHNNGNKGYHSLIIFNNPTYEHVTQLSKHLESRYMERGLSFEERSLTFGDIVKIWPDEDFFFIPHADGHKSIIPPYKDRIEDAQKMILLMPSALEKVDAQRIKNYNDGFDRLREKDFKGGDDIAYINFSDNHNIDQYPCLHSGVSKGIHEFYCVKGRRNFETLRLAFIDPSSRIKKYDEVIRLQENKFYIEAIKIKPDHILTDNTIYLSPHLNVLIGGRSSGKSLLLSLLGKKIDYAPKNNNRSRYDGIGDGASIKFMCDADFMDTRTVLDNEVLYIEQGDIAEHFEKRKLQILAKDAGKRDEYEKSSTLFAQHKQKLQVAIDNYITAYGKCIQTAVLKVPPLSQETFEDYLNASFSLSLDRTLEERFDNKPIIDASKNIITNTMKNLEELKNDDLISLTEDEIDLMQNFDELIARKLSHLLSLEKYTQKKLWFVSEARSLIDSGNSELDSASRKKIEARQSIQNLIGEIGKNFQMLVELKSASVDLENFQCDFQNSIQLMKDITLVRKVIPQEDSIKASILSCLSKSNTAQSLYNNTLELLENIQTIKNHPRDSSAGTLKSKIQTKLNDTLFSIDNPKDFLDYDSNENSEKNSPGYNTEKYLDVVLRNSQAKMIFIDQPEDHLGNKHISQNLVDLFRELKFKKQLFLVTHNPSIVVYGDAENILIANNNEGKISYDSVVLEDKEAQRKVCETLDGGRYIFDMRAQKYNIEKMER